MSLTIRQHAIQTIASRLPGTTAVYHIGSLAHDRGSDIPMSKRSPQQRGVDAIAELAWQLCERGIVNLVQQRVGPNKWEYIAQRTRARA